MALAAEVHDETVHSRARRHRDGDDYVGGLSRTRVQDGCGVGVGGTGGLQTRHLEELHRQVGRRDDFSGRRGAVVAVVGVSLVARERAAVADLVTGYSLSGSVQDDRDRHHLVHREAADRAGDQAIRRRARTLAGVGRHQGRAARELIGERHSGSVDNAQVGS